MEQLDHYLDHQEQDQRLHGPSKYLSRNISRMKLVNATDVINTYIHTYFAENYLLSTNTCKNKLNINQRTHTINDISMFASKLKTERHCRAYHRKIATADVFDKKSNNSVDGIGRSSQLLDESLSSPDPQKESAPSSHYINCNVPTTHMIDDSTLIHLANEKLDNFYVSSGNAPTERMQDTGISLSERADMLSKKLERRRQLLQANNILN
jgi:hypothetical protein